MDNKWKAWDAAEAIETEQDAIAYLNEVLALDDPAIVQDALGDIARSKGMAALARQVGVGRESLYKSLSKTGNPRFSTIVKVLDCLGLTLRVVPKSPCEAQAV